MLSKKLILFFSFAIFISSNSTAQEELTWADFADVEFKREYNAIYELYFLVPKFGETIKSYEGKKISIKGYFLDIAGNGEVLLLSQRPMAMCFFCGGAGPETIIEVNFKQKPSFKTDQIVTLTGVLQLNSEDVDHCNYILNDTTGELVD
ncbi:hypothetical protein [Winogradskyella sp.]|uniref:hypothetical protein n=1 Tax=Winogradskyella sp. TaxID=1883156 RepID=UPI002614FD6D|nr:hypothetical protein [Winogradskyella sp.]